MTDFMPLEEVDEECLRQALFIDIIRLAPEGAELVITTDSWEGLPSVFGELMNVKKGEWVVTLTLLAREFLVQQALSDNVQTNFVHFYIVENSIELVKSYDRMRSIVIEHDFPNCDKLKAEYVTLEVM